MRSECAIRASAYLARRFGGFGGQAGKECQYVAHGHTRHRCHRLVRCGVDLPPEQCGDAISG
jgi:hypothetical protein